MKIGVLALQGDVAEHISILKRLNVDADKVRNKDDLSKIDALIIPGGESTTMGNLMKKYELDKEITKKAKDGMPIFATCAGTVLLSKKIIGLNQQSLGLIDINVERNAYGRQIESFEEDLNIAGFDDPFKGVFIRAPKIKINNGFVRSLAEFNGDVVLAQQENILVSTFHPELTNDLRLHKYFIDLIEKTRNI